MRWFHLLPALLVLSVGTMPANAADLSKIERRITKEPAYQTKSPKYCLLVFGPEAKTRIWVVQDGNALYVDRNGNGDLTEKDKRVITQQTEVNPKDKEIQRTFNAGDLVEADGKTKHNGLIVYQFGSDHYVSVSELRGNGLRQSAGRDCRGRLQFAENPSDAPIIHFNGALSICPDEAYTFTKGEKPTEFYVMLGTPGLGKGTFASISYSDVPRDVHPVAEITFPSPNGQAVTSRVVLNQRC